MTRKVRILCDPGHGGKDSGAVGNGLQEKNLTLDISKRTKKYLDDNYTGHETRLTRSTDVYLTLTERANIANRWNADLFLSQHINAGGGVGFESFVYNGGVGQSTLNAQKTIHDEIIKRTKVVDRGRKRANFGVLRQSRMTAVLTESLFIDNSNDAKKLKDNNFLQTISVAHAIGIAKAFNLSARSGSVSSDPIAPTKKPIPPKPPVKKPKPPKKSQSKYKEVKGNWTGQTLVKYMKGKPVRDLQNMLSKVHYHPNKSAKNNGVDDFYGSDTESAVYRYQSMHGLAYDGKAGKEVYRSLSGKKTASKKTSYKVGSTVTLKKSARNFATGQSILNSAKGKKYKIIQVKSDRVLLDNIMSWVKRSDVY